MKNGSGKQECRENGADPAVDEFVHRLRESLRFHEIHWRDIQKEQDETVNNTLSSIRTMLPGTTVLLGFLLMLPFSDRFYDMTVTQQVLYLVAFYLAALTTSMLLIPGIYYRIVHPFYDRKTFVNFANKILILAMLPLAGSICTVVLVVLMIALPIVGAHVVFGFVFSTTFILMFGAVWVKSLMDRERYYHEKREQERLNGRGGGKNHGKGRVVNGFAPKPAISSVSLTVQAGPRGPDDGLRSR